MEVLTKYFPNLSERQQAQFRTMEALYREWNARINVISRKDMDNLLTHHILHSLAIAKVVSFPAGSAVLDVGTGGGFPGIPLAVLFPEVRFTLCDSIGKKVKVAQAVAKGLELDNVTCVQARAESLPGKFDYVVSRAVTDLSTFYPWVKGKFTEGILYLKGGDVVEEIAEVMARHRLRRGSVHTWPVSAWIHDEYYDGKLVIFIEK